jgi:hypothetical protein
MINETRGGWDKLYGDDGRDILYGDARILRDAAIGNDSLNGGSSDDGKRGRLGGKGYLQTGLWDSIFG